MPDRSRAALAAGIGFLVAGGIAFAQSMAPINSLPNPYRSVENWGTLPAGRAWGSTSAVAIDIDGASVWVAERCGESRPPSRVDPTQSFGCDGSKLDPVLKFDPSGKLLRSFGAGLLLFPHGIHVDRDGNIWVTDGNDNLPRRRPGAPADAPMPPAPAKVVGHQVFKFSPDGKLLLTLGTRPLGAALFADPRVARQSLRFRQIRRGHELYDAACRRLDVDAAVLWARRSVFVFRGSRLLVTEVFLPAILGLKP